MKTNMRKIPDFSKYEMSEQGGIHNATTGKEIAPTNGKVRLYNDSGGKSTLVIEDIRKAVWENGASIEEKPVEKVEVKEEIQKPEATVSEPEEKSEPKPKPKKSDTMDNTEKKRTITQQIRDLAEAGSSRREITDLIMPNRGFVDNVVSKMNFDNNKDAIIEDMKTIEAKEVQKKYDVPFRFLKPYVKQ